MSNVILAETPASNGVRFLHLSGETQIFYDIFLTTSLILPKSYKIQCHFLQFRFQDVSYLYLDSFVFTLFHDNITLRTDEDRKSSTKMSVPKNVIIEVMLWKKSVET